MQPSASVQPAGQFVDEPQPPPAAQVASQEHADAHSMPPTHDGCPLHNAMHAPAPHVTPLLQLPWPEQVTAHVPASAQIGPNPHVFMPVQSMVHEALAPQLTLLPAHAPLLVHAT